MREQRPTVKWQTIIKLTEDLKLNPTPSILRCQHTTYKTNTKTFGFSYTMLPTANQRRPEPKAGPLSSAFSGLEYWSKASLGSTGAHGYTSE